MKCPNWGKILAAAALCAALCACSKPQDVLPDHTATPETSATVAPTAAVVQATATHAPTDTTVPTILPQTADAGRRADRIVFAGSDRAVCTRASHAAGRATDAGSSGGGTADDGTDSTGARHTAGSAGRRTDRRVHAAADRYAAGRRRGIGYTDADSSPRHAAAGSSLDLRSRE